MFKKTDCSVFVSNLMENGGEEFARVGAGNSTLDIVVREKSYLTHGDQGTWRTFQPLQLQKDANLQAFLADHQGDSKKDANLQEFRNFMLSRMPDGGLELAFLAAVIETVETQA